MYRRVVFISVLPLIRGGGQQRAVVGTLLAMGSSVLYREKQPFRRLSTNILVYIAQVSSQGMTLSIVLKIRSW